MNIKLFQFMNAMLKYSVVFCDAFMTLHCFLLVIGIKTWFAEYITGHCVVGAVELFVASFLLKFCWLYRSFIIHNLIVYSCIIYEREFGFGEYLTFVRYAMLISGLFLIVKLIQRDFFNGSNTGAKNNWWSCRRDGA